jgi:endonuclease III-like uncharacterized protein
MAQTVLVRQTDAATKRILAKLLRENTEEMIAALYEGNLTEYIRVYRNTRRMLSWIGRLIRANALLRQLGAKEIEA